MQLDDDADIQYENLHNQIWTDKQTDRQTIKQTQKYKDDMKNEYHGLDL